MRTNKAWLLLLPALTVMAVSAAVPLMVVVNYSVQDTFFGDQFHWVGARWFAEISRSVEFRDDLLRSLLFSTLVLVLEVPLGLYIALRMPARGLLSNVYVVLMSIPLLTPWLVVGFVWKVLVHPDLGLFGPLLAWFGVSAPLNHVVGAWATLLVMDVWHWTSLVVLLCYAGLQAIPRDYYMAARIDGASRWNVFRLIQLPKLKRVLLIAVLLRFMDSFMIYTEPYMVTRGGPGVSTTFLSVDLVITTHHQYDLGPGGAMSLVYFLIILTVSWALFNILIRRDRTRTAP